MRTTLTIDDKLAANLKKKAFEEGKSFKAVVNEAIAKGLAAPATKSPSRKRHKLRTYDMGKPLVDLTHATRLAGELEDEEIVHKMELGK